MSLIRLALIALLTAIGMLVSVPAQATLSCTFTAPDLNFGTINLTKNAVINTTAVMTASCTGGVARDTVNVCPNFNQGSGGGDGTGATRYMLNGANQLGFNIFSDSTHSTVWGSYTWGLAPTPPTIIVTLNASGAGSKNQTLYGQIFAGQTALPSGSYLSTFSGSQVQMSYADSTVGTCAAIGLMNLTSVSFNILASYTPVCTVTATALAFGSKKLLNAAVTATNVIKPICSAGWSYTIGLDGGLRGATDPTARLLADAGGTNFVTYGIYQDAGDTLPWGNTIGVNTESGTGTGALQSITSYGEVSPQTTPAPAAYSDTITVTVTY